MQYTTKLIRDFSDPAFMHAFKLYFEELGVEVSRWDELFQEMNDGRNASLLLTAPDGTTQGFIQFTPMTLENWFFTVKLGFIREFWVAPAYRRQGCGSALLKAAEDHFRSEGVYKIVLTSDTAGDFYCRRGYHEDRDITPINHVPVFVKDLR